MNIQSFSTSIPIINRSSVDKKMVCQPKFLGVNFDTVDFSRQYIYSPYARLTGCCNQYLLSEGLDREIFKKIPEMRKKTFTKESYNSLNNEEKEYLRDLISQRYRDNRRCYTSLQNDRDFFVKITKKIKNNLDKEYPEGWSFISIGGSTSVLAKTLSYMGVDVKELPFSYASTLYQGFENLDMGKYLDDVGLTKEYLSDGKKKIVADYVYTGKSLRAVEKIINETNRGNDNIEYKDIQKLLKKELSMRDEYMLDMYFFQNEQIKSYSSCPTMCEPDMYDVERMNKEYEWNMSTKLMNFALIDYFETKKGVINKFFGIFK